MKACVVGGGPAGLYAAKFLVDRGIRTTLYEKEAEIGGLYRYSLLPVSKMAPFARLLSDPKFDIKLNSPVDTVRLEQLEDGFDVFVIATGAGGPRMPDIFGAEHCISGLDVIKAFWNGEDAKHRVGKKVLIVGMGNVSMDVVKVVFGWAGRHSERRIDACIGRNRSVGVGAEHVTIVSRGNAYNGSFSNSELRSVLEIDDLKIMCSEGKNSSLGECNGLQSLNIKRVFEWIKCIKAKIFDGTNRKWWERRKKMLTENRNGSRKLHMRFNTLITSIAKDDDGYRVVLERDGVGSSEVFDSVVCCMGFENAQVHKMMNKKPMFRIGWAKHARGNVDAVMRDALLAVMHIDQMNMNNQKLKESSTM
ncbi:putative pyridine nucleotide-disulfide oxidoreductase [Ordospora pajunii]|uniref:putative pyridine nucleotide-disulfide oxidoreductase n=1 Tax=Ordospora pajunii TaxID=3039483 RepID=UPI0029526A00|nr:putative pyridine nucleotide-disulfide oxidoreductase [Ordospora pajunii]KAH9410655.1 putative pyridine nucleotide-disulfide oxidoreductase [Ordospora pajunii]